MYSPLSLSFPERVLRCIFLPPDPLQTLIVILASVTFGVVVIALILLSLKYFSSWVVSHVKEFPLREVLSPSFMKRGAHTGCEVSKDPVSKDIGLPDVSSPRLRRRRRAVSGIVRRR